MQLLSLSFADADAKAVTTVVSLIGVGGETTAVGDASGTIQSHVDGTVIAGDGTSDTFSNVSAAFHRSHSNAIGTVIAIGGVGVASNATVEPTVEARFGAGASVQAAGDAYTLAIVESSATTEATAAALIPINTSDGANSSPTLTVDIGEGATVNAAGSNVLRTILDQDVIPDVVIAATFPASAVQSLTSGNSAPAITSASAVSVVENTITVLIVTANDPDGDTPEFSIIDRADSDKFNIDSMTGALTFAVAPDFENPTDTNGDNVYEVLVKVSDGKGKLSSQTILVTVTNTAGIALLPGIQRTEDDVLGSITVADVQSLGAAAVDRWLTTGLSAAQIAALDAIEYRIEDLDDGHIAAVTGSVVVIDPDANAFGWFVDKTSANDEEFERSSATLLTADAGDAAGGIDLLTVLMHEQGHVLGLADLSAPEQALMYQYVQEGQRRLPLAGEAAGAAPGDLTTTHFLNSTDEGDINSLSSRGANYVRRVGLEEDPGGLVTPVIILKSTIAPTINMNLSSDARLGSSQDIVIGVDIDLEARAVGGGAPQLIIPLAVVIPEATVSGTINVFLGGTIEHDGDLTLELRTNTRAVAIGEALAIGSIIPVSGTGVSATATVNPTISTFVQDSATITTTGDFTIRTISRSDVTAEARGVAAAPGASVAVSLAEATMTPTVSTFIGDGATINTGGGITVETLHNYATNGTKTGDDAKATAQASAGALIGGGTGSDANATASANVSAFAGPNATLRAGDVIKVTGTAGNDGIYAVSSVSSDGSQITLDGSTPLLANETDSDGASFVDRDATLTTVGGQQGGQQAVFDTSNNTITVESGGTPVAGFFSALTTDIDGDITIRALADNSAAADGRGLAIGAIGVGAALSSATANGSTSASLDGDVVQGGNLNVLATSTNKADSDATATAGGVLSGAGADADATAGPAVAASIASGRSVNVSGSVVVEAVSEAEADADAKGVSGGLVGIGVSLSDAKILGSVTSTVDADTTIAAGEDVIVRARHNMDTSGNALARKADAFSSASAGGVLAGSGGEAKATAATDVSALVNSGVSITAGSGTGADNGDDILIQAFSNNDAKAAGDGKVGGLVGVGAIVSDAVVAGATRAQVFGGGAGALDADGDIQVFAKDRSLGDAFAEAAAGGLFSGAGADSGAVVTRAVTASFGSAVDAAGNVTVSATGDIRSQAKSQGTAVGGLSAGVSIADATTSATVQASVDDGADIDAGKNIDVSATFVPSANAAKAEAIASAGSLIGGSGASATGTATADVSATVHQDATLRAGSSGDIGVAAAATNKLFLMAKGDAVGLVSGGRSDAIGTITTNVRARVDDRALLTAGRNLDVTTSARSIADVESRGGVGAVVGGGNAKTRLTVTNLAETTIGRATLSADGSLSITAIGTVDIDADAIMAALGVLASATKAEVDVDVNAQANVIIADGAIITANTVVIDAKNQYVIGGSADSRTDVALVGAFSTAVSDVDIFGRAAIIVGAGAEITGTSSLNMTAANVEIGEVESRTKSRANTGFLATAAADSRGGVDVDAVIGTAAMSKLVTSALTINANSDVSLDRIPDASAEGVLTRLVRQVERIVRRITRWLPWPLDKIVETIFRTIVRFVKVVEISVDTAKASGINDSPDDSITLNGDMVLGGDDSRILIVRSDGTIHPVSNIGATIDNGRVIVNDVVNTETGSAEIQANRGTVGGLGTFVLPKVLAEVRIENYSDRDIEVQQIDLVSENAGNPDVAVTDKDGGGSPFAIRNAGGDGSRIAIINHSTNPDADIIFTKSLDDQSVIATFYLETNGGDVAAADQNVSIRVGDAGGMYNEGLSPISFLTTNDPDLDAFNATYAGRINGVIGQPSAMYVFANGQIGSSSLPLKLELLRGKDFPDGRLESMPIAIEASAVGDIFMTVTAQNTRFTNVDPSLEADGVQLDLTSANGNINLTGTSGVLFTPQTSGVTAAVGLIGTPVLEFSDGISTLSGSPTVTFADNLLTVSGATLTFDGQVVDLSGMPLVTFDGQIVATGNPTLGFQDNDGFADTITRDSGSWLADGFLSGQTITVSGPTANAGTYEIADLSQTVLTLTAAAVLTTEAGVTASISTPRPQARITRGTGSFITDGFAAGLTITVGGAGGNNGSYLIASVDATAITLDAAARVVNATDVSSVTIAAPKQTITRAAGNWIADGFMTDQMIAVTGGTNNDGTYTLASVSELVLTLLTDAAILIDDVDVIGATVEADRGAHTISRDGGSWLADGFAIGQSIDVTDTDFNNGMFTIASLDATTITLASGDALIDETDASLTIRTTQGPITIERDGGSFVQDGFTPGQNITVLGTTGSNDNTFLIDSVIDTTLTLASSSSVTDQTIDLAANSVTITADTQQVVSEGVTLQAQNANAIYEMLAAEAGGDVNINVIGDLKLSGVKATGGTATIVATGAIMDGDNPQSIDVIADTISLTAASIGAAANPLDIDATATSAALFASADGNIDIADVAGGLSVGDVTSLAGNITLATPDAQTAGQDLVLNDGATVRAIGGSVTLLAGDNVAAATGSLIEAASAVVISGDVGTDPDGGATIDLLGAIDTATLDVIGGAEADAIALRRIQPGMATMIDGGLGNDQIFIGSAVTAAGATGGTLQTIDAARHCRRRRRRHCRRRRAATTRFCSIARATPPTTRAPSPRPVSPASVWPPA